MIVLPTYPKQPLDPPDHLLERVGVDSELQDILVDCYRSTELFAATILHERFYRPFDGLHRQIFEIIDDPTIRKAAIAAPRGIGKTSITNLAKPAKDILYDDCPYIVPVGHSSTNAVLQSENLKKELMSNEMIRKMFRPIKSDVFSKEQWVANNHIQTCVMPRGAGQQIRGLLYGNHRPNIIIVDDLEDPEQVDSDEQRRKKKQWFFADLMNAVDLGRRDWRVIVLGTILHEDSLLVDLLDDPRWESICLSLCEAKTDRETNKVTFKSLAPNFIPDEEVQEIYESYKSQNQVGTFYREHMNIPVPVENAKFREDQFKYYGADDDVDYTITEDELSNDRDCISAVLIDPAKTMSQESADSAIVGVTFNTLTKGVFVRDVISDKFFPDQIYAEAFDMALRINAKVIGVEVTGLNNFIIHPLKNAMLGRGLIFKIVELKAGRGTGGPRSGKLIRIASLSPLYRGGFVYHNRNCCEPLERQLMAFPKSKKWDIMDVLAYITALMDSGELFFSPDDEDNDNDAIAAEMAEIEAMQNDGPLEFGIA